MFLRLLLLCVIPLYASADSSSSEALSETLAEAALNSEEREQLEFERDFELESLGQDASGTAAPDFYHLFRRSVKKRAGRGKFKFFTPDVTYGIRFSGPSNYSEGKKTMIAPASTSKLFTAAVVLKELGGDFRYETRVAWTQFGSNAATLKVIGSGDPTLTSGEMTELFRRAANQLQASGITAISGELEISATDERWNDRTIPEGWNRGRDLRNGDGTLGGATGQIGRTRLLALLRTQLAAKGIAWTTSPAPFPVTAGRMESLAHLSSELRILLRPMLLMSINCHAEAHLRKVGELRGSRAVSLHAAGLSILREFVAARIGSNSFQIYDGSGLSRKSRVNAEGLVRFLEEIKREPYFKDLVSGLPIAGQTGTLKRRMRQSSANGRIRGKTGTLNGNYQLAGYVAEPTKNGTEYHPFAILSDTSTGNGSYVRSVTDAALGSLASYMLRN